MSGKPELQTSYNGGITPVQQMISSCSGALLTSLFVTPLDVVKIRLQAQHKVTSSQVTPLDVIKIRLQAQQKPITKGQCFLYCNGLMDHVCTCFNGAHESPTSRSWYRRPGQFNGTLDAFVKISRSEGLSSLWSGLPPTLLMAVPATVIYFTAYDQLKIAFDKELPNQKHLTPLLAGGIARLGAATIVNPLELLRTKMQSKKLSYLEVKEAVRSAIDQRGILSLWRGWGPTILRDVPFSAFYWFHYEKFKKWWLQTYNISQPTFIMTFSSGAAAGTIAAMLTNPFDVVKTHRQIELGELEVKGETWKVSSTSTMLKKLYKERGVFGLYAGLTPRIIKIAPACAIMISSYEFGKSFFRHYNHNHYSSMHQSTIASVIPNNSTDSPPSQNSPKK